MANKTHNAFKSLGLRTSVLAVASCLALSGVPLAAQAAGLGKIVVFSSLGQPLRAEIELSVTREELSDMRAQLASPDAFKQAGLDYATTLLGIRFSLDKRTNGQSVIKLSSDKPINDPFVDMLLELNWPAGRLVREYTFLLDPPDIMAKGSPAVPVVPPTVKSAVTSGSARTATIDEEVRGKAMAKVRTQAPAQKAADQTADGQNVREVRRGDTLHKIASETKPEGVTLEQMLVGLLRANQDAFDGGNMNRLKAGKILSVPDKSAIEAVSSGEAKKIIVAQSSDWNAYRNKLAGVAAQSPIKEEASRQDAAGKITAKVEDKAASAEESKDQLKVSKTDTSGAKSGTASKRSEEDQIAKEKALKEANQRLASLEKSVSDLQKLIELKNQNLAELQKQAAAKPAPFEVKKPAEEVKPVSPPPASAAVVASPPAKVEPVVVEKPVEKVPDPKPVEAVPVPKPEPKPVEVPKPVAKPVVPPPPVPLEEPGFMSDLLDNPLALAGGGGLLALIAAFFVARRRRAGKEEVPLNLGSTLTPQGQSLTANSVFRSTGGQSVDTSHTPAQTDFSQAGPGSIDTDEVDPVAEADVYMAYGRDVQAEEILIEARQKDPKRYAIHLKLLEIYSNRKDLKQFESLATDLYGETGGVGADWEKAAAMGLKLDPANPLFGNAAQAGLAAFDADATVIVPSSSVKNTVSMPGELSRLAAVAIAEELSPEPAAPVTPVAPDLANLDFDLGMEEEKPAPLADVAKDEMIDTLSLPESAVETGALDFDLGMDAPFASTYVTAGADETKIGLDFGLLDVSVDTPPSEAVNSTEVADLDFDLGIELEPAAANAGEQSDALNDVPEVGLLADDGVEFDVSLTESTFLGRSMPEPTSFDMSSIDLDLNEPPAELPVTPPVVETEVSSELPDLSDTSEFEFDRVQVSTAVNPDFSIEQAETVVSPSFGVEPDLLPEQDFLMEQSETLIVRPLEVEPSISLDRDFEESQADTQVNPQFGVETDDLVPEFDISSNEEVSTKLDLAKAYEEMGDLEGARELLQEVVKEGDATQREKAQAILIRISD